MDKKDCLELKNEAMYVWQHEQISTLEMMEVEELLEKYNTISAEKARYMKNCRMHFSPEFVEEHTGLFDAALVKIVAALMSRYAKAGETVPEDIRNRFSEGTIAAVKDFDRFSAFDRRGLTPQRVAEQIKNRGELYTLISEAVEKQYISLSFLRNIWQYENAVPNNIITVMEEGYEDRFGKVRDGIVVWLTSEPTALVQVFRKYEEALMESRKVRELAGHVAEEIERESQRIYETLQSTVEEKEHLEERLAEIEGKLREENLQKEMLAERLEMIQRERNSLNERLSEAYRGLDSRFSELEKKRLELEEQERKLNDMKATAKKEALMAVEGELSVLREQISRYEKAVNEYKAMKAAAEAENMALKEKIEEINDALSGKTPSRVVHSADAKHYELSFIGRFDRKMNEMPVMIPDPLKRGRSIRVKRWNVDDTARHISSSQKEQVASLNREKWEQLPFNLTSRYMVYDTSLFSGKKLRGIVEARSFGHLAEYARLGMDTMKAGLGELQAIIFRAVEEAGKGGYFHILGIESPTGWDQKAIDFLMSEDYQINFMNKYVYVYLIDMEMNEVYYNRVYDEISPEMKDYAGLFAPELKEEKVQKCRDWIKSEFEELSKTKGKYELYVTLEDAARKWGEDMAKKVFNKMSKEDGYGMEKIPEVGTILRKR